MSQITLYVKRNAANKELLEEVSGEDIELDVEAEQREPTVSKAPVSEVVTTTAQLVEYFNAPTVALLLIKGAMTAAGGLMFVTFWNKVSKFIAANNRKKGNAWGAKVEMQRDVGGKNQSLHFFLDNLPEGSLETAYMKIPEKIKAVTSDLQDSLLKQIKHIGYQFDDITEEWKMIGFEKFDGDTGNIS